MAATLHFFSPKAITSLCRRASRGNAIGSHWNSMTWNRKVAGTTDFKLRRTIGRRYNVYITGRIPESTDHQVFGIVMRQLYVRGSFRCVHEHSREITATFHHTLWCMPCLLFWNYSFTTRRLEAVWPNRPQDHRQTPQRLFLELCTVTKRVALKTMFRTQREMPSSTHTVAWHWSVAVWLYKMRFKPHTSLNMYGGALQNKRSLVHCKSARHSPNSKRMYTQNKCKQH